MSKKKNIRRTLYTLLIMLLLSTGSFLSGYTVNRIMIVKIEERFYARIHSSLEQESCHNLEVEEYPEWQR